MKKFLVPVQAVSYTPSGLTGATAAVRFVGGTASGAPASGTFVTGDVVVAQNGHIFVCTAGGTPGTWADAGTASGVTSVAGRSGIVTLTAPDIGGGTFPNAQYVFPNGLSLGTGAQSGIGVHSDGTNIYVEATTAGHVYLRPNGVGSNTGFVDVSTTGVTLVTPLTITAATMLLGPNTGSSAYYVNGGAGSPRGYAVETAGSMRWFWGANTAAETGANAGSGFALFAYADDGVTLLSSPLQIVRATGAISLNAATTIQGDQINHLLLSDTHAAQTTPKKYLRSQSGEFQIVNDANSAIPFKVGDTGLVSATGSAAGYYAYDRDGTNRYFAFITSGDVLRLYSSTAATDRLLLDSAGNLAVSGGFDPGGTITMDAGQAIVFGTTGPTDFGGIYGTSDGNFDFRATASGMRWVNHAYSVVIMSLTNAGNLLTAGSITSASGELLTNSGVGAARVRYLTQEGNTGSYIDTRLDGNDTVGVVGRNTGAKTLVVRPVGSQSANQQEWQDSAGATLVSIAVGGQYRTISARTSSSSYGAYGQPAVNIANDDTADATAKMKTPGLLNFVANYWTGAASAQATGTLGFTVDAAGGATRLKYTADTHEFTGIVTGTDLRVSNTTISRGRIGGVAEANLTAQVVLAASAATEVMVTGLADVSLTIVTGRRYLVTVKIPIVATVSLDIEEFSIRANGGSAPTTASTLIRSFRQVLPGTSAAHYELMFEMTGAAANGTGTLAAGTNRIGLTCKRVVGTGGWTLNSATLTTFLQVEDIGT